MSNFSPKGTRDKIFFLLLLSPFFITAQTTAQDTLKEVTLKAAVDYASNTAKIQQSYWMKITASP